LVGAATLSTPAAANSAFSAMASAINTMSTLLARMGGQVSLIESKATIVSQMAVSQKEQEAQINELDFAKEMKNFTSLQVVLQASNAMVAQANTKAQMVLQLFK
jgi:flagellin